MTTVPDTRTVVSRCETVADTHRHARLWAKRLAKNRGPALILLSGDLGAGKTEWTRAFVRTFLECDDDLVSSPTFSILQEYKNQRQMIMHGDLYRVKTAEDLESLGFWDYFETAAIMIIEWAERLDEWKLTEQTLDRSSLHLHFTMDLQGIRNISARFSQR